jgi:hypothetical protein
MHGFILPYFQEPFWIVIYILDLCIAKFRYLLSSRFVIIELKRRQIIRDLTFVFVCLPSYNLDARNLHHGNNNNNIIINNIMHY